LSNSIILCNSWSCVFEVLIIIYCADIRRGIGPVEISLLQYQSYELIWPRCLAAQSEDKGNNNDQLGGHSLGLQTESRCLHKYG